MWNQGQINKGAGRAKRGRKHGGRESQSNHRYSNGSIGDFFGPNTPSRSSPPLDHKLGQKERDNVENRPKTAAEVSRMTSLKAVPDQSYTIGGVKIRFPCKPYPSQFSMMDKIVKGLDRHQNCLLESPTGSGKSLALLCSALAWQRTQAEKMEKEVETKDCCCKCSSEKASVSSPVGNTSHYFSTESHQKGAPPQVHTQLSPNNVPVPSSPHMGGEDDDDDFQTAKKKIRGSFTPTIKVPGGRQHLSIGYDSPAGAVGPLHDVTNGAGPGAPPNPTTSESYQSPTTDCASCQCHQGKAPKTKLPKIYFGTRTHKQIAQIVRELAKTAYRDIRMCILSSREQTCIDPEVSTMIRKNEECKNKLDGPGCMFFDNVRKITHRNLEANGLDEVWDLEDFVAFNKKHRACAYYGARQLREGADIIFCPYNYLIDPSIRETMEIMLKDQVVILDEAHNIEDSAREAASFSATQKQLGDAMSDLDNMMEANIKFTEHSAIKGMLMSLNDLIERFRHTLGGDQYDQASRVWNGVDMVAQLRNAGIGPEKLATLKQHFAAITDDEIEENFGMKIHASTEQVLGGIFMVLDYIYRENMRYMTDYRVALVRSISYQDVQTNNTWMSRKRRGPREVTWIYTLHFWCLNPAVAFSDLSSVRSIVLTSGTLSPMNSFQSELGMKFPIQLEANHVIGPKQVWVGAVSKGPRGTALLGSYQSTETFTYQDDLGQVVLSVCKTVPHGVLCFLSSYKMLEKLQTRWKNTGVYDELTRHKVILCEPRGSDKNKVDFDELLKYFYTIIKDTEHADETAGEVTGALFLAVCRGKVSEGMDFTDNNARAVITVGIPFPNIKDTQVELKKQYNNEHSSSRGLLSGSEWYQIQAYRAINQALGRCIRHRHDWGALILVDERFAKNPARYTNGLSKWVRQRVQYYGNFMQAQRSLHEFTQTMLQTPPAPGMDQSLSVSQMDLSVAVETHKTPTPCTWTSASPGPTPGPVVVPTTRVHSSPPMDLETSSGSLQRPVARTINLGSPVPTVKSEATTTFVLPSQAGGFILSQGPGSQPIRIIATVPNIPTSSQIAFLSPKQPVTPSQKLMTSTQVLAQGPGSQPIRIMGTVPNIPTSSQIAFLSPKQPVTPSQELMTSTQVLSGPLFSQEIVVDDDIEFNPAVASTQVPGALTFDPLMTSTQMSPCQKGNVRGGTTDFQPASSVMAQLLENKTTSTASKNSSKVNASRAPVLVSILKRAPEKKPEVLVDQKPVLPQPTPSPQTGDPPTTTAVKPGPVQKGQVSGEVGRNKNGIGKDSQMFQFDNISCDKIQPPEDYDIDARSNSPCLFDSDEDVDVQPISDDFDTAIRETSEDKLLQVKLPETTIKADHAYGKSETSSVVGNLSNRKPLFKSEARNLEGQPSECVHVEMSEVDAKTVPSNTTGRGDQQCMDTSIGGATCDIVQAPGGSTKTAGRVRGASRRLSLSSARGGGSMSSRRTRSVKGVVYEEPLPSADGAVDTNAAKRDADQDGDETEEETLKTKRYVRNKRRRISSGRLDRSREAASMGPDLLDQVDDGDTLKDPGERPDSVVVCRRCNAKLSNPLTATKDEELPGFVRKDPSANAVSQTAVVCRVDDISGDTCLPIHTPLSTGMSLDCTWNADAGCCLEYYRCLQCGPLRSFTPVAALLLAVSPQSTLDQSTVGKVWFLPECVTLNKLNQT